MLCNGCQSEPGGQAMRRSHDYRCQAAKCDRCGAIILMLEGVPVGVGDGTLARLARFGLANTGHPLLAASRDNA